MGLPRLAKWVNQAKTLIFAPSVSVVPDDAAEAEEALLLPELADCWASS